MAKKVDVKLSLKSVEYAGNSIGRDLVFIVTVGQQNIVLSSQNKGPGETIDNKGIPKTIDVKLTENKDGEYLINIQTSVQEQDKLLKNCDYGTSNADINIFEGINGIPNRSANPHTAIVKATDYQIHSKPTATFTFNLVTETFDAPR